MRPKISPSIRLVRLSPSGRWPKSATGPSSRTSANRMWTRLVNRVRGSIGQGCSTADAVSVSSQRRPTMFALRRVALAVVCALLGLSLTGVEGALARTASAPPLPFAAGGWDVTRMAGELAQFSRQATRYRCFRPRRSRSSIPTRLPAASPRPPTAAWRPRVATPSPWTADGNSSPL